MMNKSLIIFIFSVSFFLSCSNLDRDKPVNSSKLTGDDYRLFQKTPAWGLAKAVQDEDVTEINRIISEKPELINYQESKYGKTLLMLSIRNQQRKSFKTLLERKADVNKYDTFSGTSAIIEACSSKYYDISFAETLVKYGANVNDIEKGVRRKGNSTRETPLMAAVQTGNLSLVKFLLSKGADIDYQNEFGQSALGKSVLVHKYGVAYFLLQKGADYKRPIFYRPDYSVPAEKQDPNDKGKPMYLAEVLKENTSDIGANEYNYKKRIIDFLKSKGM